MPGREEISYNEGIRLQIVSVGAEITKNSCVLFLRPLSVYWHIVGSTWQLICRRAEICD